jgi:hypothetical protein
VSPMLLWSRSLQKDDNNESCPHRSSDSSRADAEASGAIRRRQLERPIGMDNPNGVGRRHPHPCRLLPFPSPRRAPCAEAGRVLVSRPGPPLQLSRRRRTPRRVASTHSAPHLRRSTLSMIPVSYLSRPIAHLDRHEGGRAVMRRGRIATRSLSRATFRPVEGAPERAATAQASVRSAVGTRRPGRHG